jgi:fibronectin type 3 domain-containing protein
VLETQSNCVRVLQSGAGRLKLPWKPFNSFNPPFARMALSWTGAVTGVTGYNAYASTVSGGPFVKMTSAPLTSPSYTDTNLQPDRTYYYVVTALNASDQESAYSSEVTAIVP